MANQTDSLLVREVMTKEAATLKVTDHLDLAQDIMTLGRIRHMPVVKEEKLVGIVSQRDLFLAAVSSVLNFRRAAEREWLAKIRVEEVMSHPVQTAVPDWPIGRAVETMLSHKVGCLPVIEHGRIVGMLSETDCLHLLSRLLAGGEKAEVGGAR